jgi:hypothetical protein
MGKMEVRPTTTAEKVENLAITALGGAFSLAFFGAIGLWFYRALF